MVRVAIIFAIVILLFAPFNFVAFRARASIRGDGAWWPRSSSSAI